MRIFLFIPFGNYLYLLNLLEVCILYILSAIVSTLLCLLATLCTLRTCLLQENLLHLLQVGSIYLLLPHLLLLPPIAVILQEA